MFQTTNQYYKHAKPWLLELCEPQLSHRKRGPHIAWGWVIIYEITIGEYRKHNYRCFAAMTFE